MRFRSLLLMLVAGWAAAPAAVAGPALLLDAASGKVLYAEDYDDLWHPASLTKIMTAYLTFEALKAGQLTNEAKLSVSQAANLQPPSKVGLPVGAEMTVELAVQALIIKSANDVAVMLAEALGGSEAGFVEKMNAAAARLGMTRTKFVNANGLPAPEQVTTARDLSKLARAVLRDFPEYAQYWAMPDMHLGKRRLGTHNQLLKTYDGADGMKTGFICDSGYNVVASATRNGVRLLAVVLGESSGRTRTIRAEGLLEHGFLTYGWKTYFEAPSAEDLPAVVEPRGATSIRKIVMATECGNRRRVPTVAEKRQKAKQARAAQSGSDADAARKSNAAATTTDSRGAGKARKAAIATGTPLAPPER